MTREEAKSFLTDISYKLGNMAVEYLTEKDGEKMREAIKALEQAPCEDCISRADAKKYLSAPNENGDRVIYASDLDLLLPVKPERPKGEWEEYGHNIGDDYIPVGIRCSKCHVEPPKRDPHKDKSFMNYIKSDFCPKCGAIMIESQESEDRK